MMTYEAPASESQQYREAVCHGLQDCLLGSLQGHPRKCYCFGDQSQGCWTEMLREPAMIMKPPGCNDWLIGSYVGCHKRSPDSVATGPHA